MNRTDSKQKL